MYLTTGFDMSYNPAMQMGHHMFDNVFVNSEAYNAFLETGTCPTKPCSSSRAGRAKDKGSINQAGSYQGTEVMGVEIHVKDEARFPGKWAFFIFDNAKTAKMVPPDSVICYSCHAQHAAVDTTFVQFLPDSIADREEQGNAQRHVPEGDSGHRTKAALDVSGKKSRTRNRLTTSPRWLASRRASQPHTAQCLYTALPRSVHDIHRCAVSAHQSDC